MRWIIAKRILRELKNHKNKLIIVAIAGLLMAGSYAQMIIMIKQMFDSLQSGKSETVLNTSLVILGLAFLNAITRYFHLYTMNITSELVGQSYRQQLQKKFMTLNLTFHNQNAAGSGGLITRILADISNIQNGLRLFADFFREPIQLTFSIGWLFWINWKLTISIIVLLPIILFLTQSLSKSIHKYHQMGQRSLEDITSTVKETLDGVRIIQSFNLQPTMEKRFANDFVGYLGARKKIHSRIEIAGPVTEFLTTALIIGLLLFLSYQISKGSATYGDFASYLATLLSFNKPIKVLQDALMKSQEMIVSAGRVYEILDEKSEVPVSERNLSFPKHWNTLSYKNVSFGYGEELVLKNFNVEIKKGQTIALVGASGSGKSTVVNLLERFFDPQQGEILVDDISIRDINLFELRKNISLVNQDVYLFKDSIEYNIWSGDFEKSKDGVERAAKIANAHSFISKMSQGYQSSVGERGGLLSGGEKQRLSIARAVFKDAPILVLDEATSALDTQSEQEVQKALDALMDGRTAIVIAHRLSTIAKADKILVLKHGVIVESGTQSELLEKKGEYYRLHQIQFANH